jgi:hypothetical protein
MLCGLPTVQQAAIGDCLSFDPFSFDQNGLAAPDVNVGWRQIVDALVIAQVMALSHWPRIGDFRADLARRRAP